MKSEEELLQLLKNGDEETIKLIFDRYYEGLCLYAESLIRNHQLAEEIVEDIFIHLWMNAQHSGITKSLKSYLFRSVHNNCLKYLDKLKTERKSIENISYTLQDYELLHPLTSDLPISNLIAQELEEKANKILESLPSQCKEIYSLNRFENLSYSEIAKKLNITVGTVKTQMSRAFQKFRDDLREYISLVIIALFLK
jgi:RNA polymerase sigma-70 factor (ECF subfamily)